MDVHVAHPVKPCSLWYAQHEGGGMPWLASPASLWLLLPPSVLSHPAGGVSKHGWVMVKTNHPPGLRMRRTVRKTASRSGIVMSARIHTVPSKLASVRV